MRIAPVMVNGFRTGLLIAALLLLPMARSGAQRGAASRAGISPVAAVVPLSVMQRTDSVAKGRSNRRSHILIGAGIGGVIGGAFGGVNTGKSKGTGTSYDGTATAGGVVVGAIIGALWGGVIGAFVPHS